MKEELVEGIKQAVSRGESLEKAMTTFYNAGYKKEEIEEAAAAFQAPVFQQPFQQSFQQPQQQLRAPAQQPLARQLVPQQQTVVQRVSEYGKKPSRKGMAITIILVVILLLLVGILATVILFKDEISSLFSNFFLRALF